MTNPDTWRLLYSNFYKPGSPRFAYTTTRRNYMTKKAYQGNCSQARSGSICTDNVGARCYKLGANSYNCAGSPNDKGLSDDEIKKRGEAQGPNTGGASILEQVFKTGAGGPTSGGDGGGGSGFTDLLKNPMVIAALAGGVVLIVIIAMM